MGQTMNAPIRLLGILFSWVLLVGVRAQSWCPSPGVEWWHTYSQVGGAYGHVHTTYGSDSLIDGVFWQKLQVVATWRDLSSSGPVMNESWFQLTRVEAQTVFLRQTDEVDTLYRFDPLIGDRWSVPFVEPELTYVVTDVGVRVVGGIDLSWSAVDVVTSEGDLFFVDTLVERFGFLDQYINPVYSLNLEPTIGSLRCYADDELSYHVASEGACDVITRVASVNGQDYGVWYDPMAGQLHVELPDGLVGAFVVTDISGRILRQGIPGAGTNHLALGFLSPGAYVLRVADEVGRLWARKWVIP